ncbi:MAG: dihydropteroate synthase [Deltaproteobacteria bacterium]|nr:dihydropteroate synthase [Deltaproteobacteria bacterium]
MLIIADRIDATRKYIAQAVLTENRGFIESEARDQAASGADYINLNAAVFGADEEKRLRWMIETVQEATDVPLCIDSPNPAVIEKMLPLVRKTPMINSITLQAGRAEAVLRLVIESGAKVIASCQADQSSAETAEEKFEIAGRLIRMATQAGVDSDDLYIDPLVYSLSTNPRSARATLDAIGKIKTGFHGVHTVCCLSTVSYGLPCRNLLHRTFLAAAMERGLDSAIIDTTDAELAAVVLAGRLISGRETDCLDYIRAFREGRLC